MVRELGRIPGLRVVAGVLGFLVLAGIAIALVLWIWDQRSEPVTGETLPAVTDPDGGEPRRRAAARGDHAARGGAHR